MLKQQRKFITFLESRDILKTICIKRIINDMKLEVIHMSDKANIEITKSEVNRLGLQLTGFFQKFVCERIQIIGGAEWEFLSSLDAETRQERLDMIFEYPIPALVICRDLEVFPEILDAAKRYNKTVLRTDMDTTKFMDKLIDYIDDVLAPQVIMHGVLIEVYGFGVLLTGKSGVGKSETALELIERGHSLVADDSVIIKRIDDKILKGTSPELIRHYIEIRGIGIIDIERLYGVSAVKTWEAIDMVAELELWNEGKEYDRLGLDEKYIEILDVKIPKVTIPVKPGRNLAMIVEVAVRNARQKQFGYNSAIELDKRIKTELENKKRS